MNRYIHQLIEDLNKASLNVPDMTVVYDNVDYNDEEEAADLALFEKYLYGEEEPLSEILGIEKILLPPMERLSVKQMGTLYPHIEDLLGAYNFKPGFPDGVPVEMKYFFVREIWDDYFVYVSAGITTIDFCEQDCDFCPFGSELCRCKEL